MDKMYLNTLKEQSRLSIGELGQFFEDFLSTYDEYMVLISNAIKNEVEKEYFKDIDLNNKQVSFRESLTNYSKRIIYARKFIETDSMKELHTWRLKQFSNHKAYIKSFTTDCDKAKQDAALEYEIILSRYKYISKETVSSINTTIESYIMRIQDEKHKDAYELLELEKRTNELRETNRKYMELSNKRIYLEKNHPKSPSQCRQQCMDEYRNLVHLINFAERNNVVLLYDDMIEKLSATTSSMQELINRRVNAAKKRKENPMMTIMEQKEEEESSVMEKWEED